MEFEVCQGMEGDGMINTVSLLQQQQQQQLHRMSGSSYNQNHHYMQNNNSKLLNQHNNNTIEYDFVHVSDDYEITVDCYQPYRTKADENNIGVSKLCVFSYPPKQFVMEEGKSSTSSIGSSESNSNSNSNSTVIGTLFPGQKVTALQALVMKVVNHDNDDDNNIISKHMPINPSSGGCGLGEDGFTRLNVWDAKRAVFLFVRYSDRNDNENGIIREGYICYSLDSYAFLRQAPMLETYTKLKLSEEDLFSVSPKEPLSRDDWLWRVTYSGGALIRSGIELSSEQLGILPFGSFVRVLGRVINNMGLSRLYVQSLEDRLSSKIDGDKNHDTFVSVKGYISERLNPLSGQSGFIAKLLPFSFPRIYKIVLSEGAVIREGKELSSREVGKLENGSIIHVCSMEYSEHPADKCIERVKLLDSGHFISLKLNKHPPRDVSICELVGEYTDIDFAAYSYSYAYTSSETSDGKNPVSASSRCEDYIKSDVPYSDTKNLSIDKKCVICLLEERTSTIVHGETGHIACCLGCARILKARGDRCPVCRLEIENVIQHFWA